MVRFFFEIYNFKLFFVKKGIQKIPNQSFIEMFQVKGVVNDLKKNKVFKKRTGYSNDGIYEHAFLLKYFEIAKKIENIIDIGSGPGTQIKSLIKLFEINKKSFNFKFDQNFFVF